MKRIGHFSLLFFAIIGCDQPTPQMASNEQKPAPSLVFVPDAQIQDRYIKPDPLAHQPQLSPAERILIRVGDTERFVSEAVARDHGYTIVDFRNSWVPKILDERYDQDGTLIPNNYRASFQGLANDKIDVDGSPLGKEELNFLEVFGVPPSLGVVAGRMLADAEKLCLQDIDYALISNFEFIPITKWDHRRQKRRLKRRAKAVKRFEETHGTLSFEEIREKDPAIAKMVLEQSALPRTSEAFLEIEKRMFCDDHIRKRFRHKKGRRDDGFQKAVRRFQRKHKLYVWGLLEEDTLAALGKPPQALNYASFRRVLRERIVAATGILEDGTAEVNGQPATYTDSGGTVRPVRNLVQEFLDAALAELDLADTSKTLEFVKRHGVQAFETLRVGVKFPELPEYYSAQMDLALIVDRGSVWYDFPYTDSGRKKRQLRKKFPTMRLMLTHNGETFPLTAWRTTIGGWAEEQAENGYVYLKYKMSDVGKRVIRKIVAAPTWRPPETTPISTLVKRKWVNGKSQRVVNYNDMGPGYLSAFGVVAGYFVIPGKKGRGDWDKGIRAHGSSNYMSIMSKRGFSHGCHRLQNDRAIRLYGFLLSHRNHKVHGELEQVFRRTYLHDEEVYEIYLPSQGFKYELDPPIDVEVLEGTLEGELEEPIEELMEIPGKEYPVPIDFLEQKDLGLDASQGLGERDGGVVTPSKNQDSTKQ